MNPVSDINKSATSGSYKILIVSSIDVSLLRFRGKLIELLVEEGYEVFVAAPEFSESIRKMLESLGARCCEFPLNRTGMNPFQDKRSKTALREIIFANKVNLVFSYNVKPVIYGSHAARSEGVTSISLITGLGYGFSGDTVKARILGKLLTAMYRKALSSNKAVIFQNTDDQALFNKHSLVPQSAANTVVDGSGVDLQEFAWREPSKRSGLRFMFAGRLIKEKGVGLYIEAADELKKHYPEAEFFVLGDPQPGSPSSIDLDRLNTLNDAEVLTHFNRRTDIAEFMASCDVLVLPSYYREGVPRSILEALSTGLAVITTDSTGCRETVNNGLNGILVEPKNLTSLVEAMRTLLDDPNQVEKMSYASRELAENRFDVTKVNNDILRVIRSVVLAA